jgi:hypothetical protein
MVSVMAEHIEQTKEGARQTIENLRAELYRQDKQIARLRRELVLAKKEIREWMQIAAERDPLDDLRDQD